jgi:hypothetical protein
MPTIYRKLSESENSIVESNSILRFLYPDLYLTVLDPATGDFKPSAREFLDLADAIILHNRESSGRTAEWGTDLDRIKRRRIFRIQAPNYVDRKIVQFVRERLASSRDRQS